MLKNLRFVLKKSVYREMITQSIYAFDFKPNKMAEPFQYTPAQLLRRPFLQLRSGRTRRRRGIFIPATIINKTCMQHDACTAAIGCLLSNPVNVGLAAHVSPCEGKRRTPVGGLAELTSDRVLYFAGAGSYQFALKSYKNVFKLEIVTLFVHTSLFSCMIDD